MKAKEDNSKMQSSAGSTLEEEESALRKSLASLDVQRKSIEHEADAIFMELTTPPSEGVEAMGVDTPLVDPEGYPRADIDIYRARTLRGRFQVLKTDHKEQAKKIDMLLQHLSLIKNPKQQEEEQKEQLARAAPKPKPKYDPQTGKWVVMNWDGSVAGVPGGEHRQFSDLSAESKEQESALRNKATMKQSPEMEASQIPFSRVNEVASGSPADTAGLKEADLILTFGPLNHSNHNHLQELAKLVPEKAAQRKEIMISVLRTNDSNEEKVVVRLLPKPWHGRGLLGCHIAPYANAE